MPCNYVSIGGHVGIVCTRVRLPKCVGCGRPKAERECDWKVADGKTCDAAICTSCTTSPAKDKDLCPTHAAEWIEWRKLHAKKKVAP